LVEGRADMARDKFGRSSANNKMYYDGDYEDEGPDLCHLQLSNKKSCPS